MERKTGEETVKLQRPEELHTPRAKRRVITKAQAWKILERELQENLGEGEDEESTMQEEEPPLSQIEENTKKHEPCYLCEQLFQSEAKKLCLGKEQLAKALVVPTTDEPPVPLEDTSLEGHVSSVPYMATHHEVSMGVVLQHNERKGQPIFFRKYADAMQQRPFDSNKNFSQSLYNTLRIIKEENRKLRQQQKSQRLQGGSDGKEKLTLKRREQKTTEVIEYYQGKTTNASVEVRKEAILSLLAEKEPLLREFKQEFVGRQLTLLAKQRQRAAKKSAIPGPATLDLFSVLMDLYQHFPSQATAETTEKLLDSLLGRYLPQTTSTTTTTTTTERLVEFQLRYCSSTLLSGSKPCARGADGFLPDYWQELLMKIVGWGDSALVVAPPSAGKTFASIKALAMLLNKQPRVTDTKQSKLRKNSLKASLVFVTANTRQARRASCMMRESVKDPNDVGLLTPEQQINPADCHILVCTASTFTSLLMTPSLQTWKDSLVYVIFDDLDGVLFPLMKEEQDDTLLAVPSLGDYPRALALIDCPFVALLSVQPSNPGRLRDWLQAVHEETKVHLIPTGIQEQASMIPHNNITFFTYTTTTDKESKTERLTWVHPFGLLASVTEEERVGLQFDSAVTLPTHQALHLYESMEVTLRKLSIAEDEGEEVKRMAVARLEDFEGYFSPSNFFPQATATKISEARLTKWDGYQYQQELKEELLTWPAHWMNGVGNSLPFPTPRETDSQHAMTADSLSQLLETLSEKKMLPALVLCHNHTGVQQLTTLAKGMLNILETKEALLSKEEETQEVAYEEPPAWQKQDRNRNHKSRRMKNILDSFKEVLPSCRFSVKIPMTQIPHFKDWVHRVSDVDPLLLGCLSRGIGIYHPLLPSLYTSFIDVLQQAGVLPVLIANPRHRLPFKQSKTVVLLGASHPAPMERHHLIAHVRNRNEDGHVVFVDMSTDQCRRLLFGAMPAMRMPPLMHVPTVLNLLILDHNRIYETSSQMDAKREEGFSSLARFHLPSCTDDLQKAKLEAEMVLHFSYSLFTSMKLLDLIENRPTQVAGLIVDLPDLYPANMVLSYFILTGFIESIETQSALLSLLCYLLPAFHVKAVGECKLSNTLPSKSLEAIRGYNAFIEKVGEGLWKKEEVREEDEEMKKMWKKVVTSATTKEMPDPAKLNSWAVDFLESHGNFSQLETKNGLKIKKALPKVTSLKDTLTLMATVLHTIPGLRAISFAFSSLAEAIRPRSLRATTKVGNK